MKKKEKGFLKFTLNTGSTVYVNPDLIISFQAEGQRQTLIRTTEFNLTVDEDLNSVSEIIRLSKQGVK